MTRRRIDNYSGYPGGDPNDFEIQQLIPGGEVSCEGVVGGFFDIPLPAPPGFGGPELRANERARLVKESDSKDHAATGLPDVFCGTPEQAQERIASLQEIYEEETAAGKMYPKRAQQILVRIVMLQDVATRLHASGE